MSIYQLTATTTGEAPDDFQPDRDDPSLAGAGVPPLGDTYRVDEARLNALFLARYELSYVSAWCRGAEAPLRVVSFPEATRTCFEKAAALDDWNPLNVIKAFYLESPDGALYAVIVPETGCFLDRDRVAASVGLPAGETLVRADRLPAQMSFGSCSPLVRPEDLWDGGGRVRHIVFDEETLAEKRDDSALDDFSFGLEHRLSIQLRYADCHDLLRDRYGDVVVARDVLRLSFKERLVRRRGRIKIDYDFKTLNYRTAKFINGIHGYGDVLITNDHVDEMFVPDVLTMA